jgi:hypothetical protein
VICDLVLPLPLFTHDTKILHRCVAGAVPPVKMQRCQTSSITVILLSPFLSLSLSIYAYTIFLHLPSPGAVDKIREAIETHTCTGIVLHAVPNTPSSSITVEYVSLFILSQVTKQNLLMLHNPIGLKASLNCNSYETISY